MKRYRYLFCCFLSVYGSMKAILYVSDQGTQKILTKQKETVLQTLLRLHMKHKDMLLNLPIGAGLDAEGLEQTSWSSPRQKFCIDCKHDDVYQKIVEDRLALLNTGQKVIVDICEKTSHDKSTQSNIDKDLEAFFLSLSADNNVPKEMRDIPFDNG